MRLKPEHSCRRSHGLAVASPGLRRAMGSILALPAAIDGTSGTSRSVRSISDHSLSGRLVSWADCIPADRVIADRSKHANVRISEGRLGCS